MAKKDNSTISLKVSLRRKALREIEKPIILETHGGYGSIFARCYADVPDGVVIEKNEQKAEHLAKQRPSWAVYEADCVNALRGGIGAHMPVNFVDCDPYGEPWPVIDAFLESERQFPATLVFVVNDGLRQMVRITGGWNAHSLQPMVDKYGSDLHDIYLEVCREMMEIKTAQLGYSLRRWAGYHCGYMGQMTHFAAIFQKENSG